MIESTCARIRDWLLTSNIQIREGLEQGGVAGWLTSKEPPSFAYTEMAGYFLTCLSFMQVAEENPDSRLSLRAQSALSWLERKAGEGKIGVTRHYLSIPQNDWRNQAVFAFDLSMVLRGLEAASRHLPVRHCQGVKEAVFQQLRRHCLPDFTLKPYYSLNGDHIPRRWSTQPGPYQMKIAAALRIAESSTFPDWAGNVSQSLEARWDSIPLREVCSEDWHAFFYYLEGLVMLGELESDPKRIEATYHLYKDFLRLLPIRPMTDFQVAEIFQRSDVLAQALRLACIFKSRGYWEETAGWSMLDGLAAGLLRFLKEDGSLVFQWPIDDPEAHRNAWSAMFAYQALSYYIRIGNGGNLDPHWIQLLI